jgi:hypothetical protein
MPKARKKSVILTKAVKPTKAIQVKAERELLAGLRNYLKGYKADHRLAKATAKDAAKAEASAGRIVSRQLVAIEKANAKIEKLRAA